MRRTVLAVILGAFPRAGGAGLGTACARARRPQGLAQCRAAPPDRNPRAGQLETVLSRPLGGLRESNTDLCILLSCPKHLVL